MKEYEDLNDYEIIYMIGENDDTAKSIMYQKYYPIIKSRANRLSKYTKEIGIDEEDLEQEGLSALASSMKNYNPNNNTLFYTYALKAIRRKMNNLIRIGLAKKNYALNTSISLDAYLTEDGANLLTFIEDKNTILPDKSLEMKVLFNNIKRLLYALPIEEASILELKMNSFKITEISTLLDISLSDIRNRLTKIRKKINLVIEK